MAEENFAEQDKSEMSEDPNPPKIQDSENELAVEEKKWPGWPGENVFRMLVPTQKVGGIIGRKGEYIKKICEETKARIKILDGPPGTTERAVLCSITKVLQFRRTKIQIAGISMSIRSAEKFI